MVARGFLVNTPREAQLELASQTEPAFETIRARDLSSLFWSSIDNDDSRDLDQVEYVKSEAAGTRVYIGIADVDWFVNRDSMIDRAAAHNTTSVYTGVLTFPMLPEKLSTDLSSLNEGVKRMAMVVEMFVSDAGHVENYSVYPAVVENKAQLTYNAVASWLESLANQSEASFTPLSEISAQTLAKIHRTPELQQQLQIQNRCAQSLRQARHNAGALTFNRSEMKPIFSLQGTVVDLETRRQNIASLLIEDFMIAANQATAQFLDDKGSPSLQRVVKTPERWDKIVAIAAARGHRLPNDPDAKSLEEFLRLQRQFNLPDFADLSLAIIKLLGRGEYMPRLPRQTAGHFALATNSYSHSTAPNRRFPDLITQRLLKGAMSGTDAPYSIEELQQLAAHCTEREDSANKVERFVKKCAAAVVLRRRMGEVFQGIVSGVTSRGTWVRVSHPEVEGKLIGDTRDADVGDHVQVRLVSVDPEHGFIDFALA
jgi:exoribonuclease-2